MSRILIVEDHPELADLIARALSRSGTAADVAGNLKQADAALGQLSYAALILDRGLPEGDGLSWLRRLRANDCRLPCLILTARDALRDRVAGLDAGADDYLPKPFEMDELVARVRALLRRQPSWDTAIPDYDDVAVDPVRAQLRSGRASINLAPSELQVMVLLVRARGQVVRRQALEAAAWGLSEAVTPNALEVVVHRLRRKLTVVGSRNQIVTTKGVGYALAAATSG
ncbi:MAG: response regulator transcription factor [Steroidobacteraceae bacterium]|jgi:DNA-binding response OmpR family regulator|nr:response regulator transcription factor [Steroidobacteraceae bacterium]